MVQQEAPWFLDQVAQSQRRRKLLTLSLHSFEDNPLLLYACLWLARQEQITVRFVPTSHAPTSK